MSLTSFGLIGLAAFFVLGIMLDDDDDTVVVAVVVLPKIEKKSESLCVICGIGFSIESHTSHKRLSHVYRIFIFDGIRTLR